MTSKGKRLTYLSISLGVLVLAIAGFALKDKAVEQWYLWKLESEDEAERKVAAARLGEMRSVRAVARLTELFRIEPIEEPHLPYSARALVKIGKPAVPALCNLLGEQHYTNRRDFIWTIGAIGEKAEAAVPYLIHSLEDEDWVVRQTTAEVLGLIGPRARHAIPALVNTLRDENEYVRNSAAGALKRIQGKSARTAR